ncbi:MAG: photosynthetic complex assembly protein PuhC [Burkholderiales bacterium]|jgi:putative photosynthetic complex assembly protein|nr:photosynthetic complex assembly protein PuhC [Burkholderiales bacterium]
MSDPFAHQPFPRGALIGAAALIAASLLAVTAARITGAGRSTVQTAPAAVERDLRFADRSDGGVDVLDAASGAPVALLAPGHDGFIRATLRSLARERHQLGFDDAKPFRMAITVDGHLMLTDTATGRQIDLGAFGTTNTAAFARLLAPAR